MSYKSYPFILGLIILGLICPFILSSQNAFEVEKGKLEYLGKSKPIKELQKLGLTDEHKLKAAKKGKPKNVPNFIGGRVLPKLNQDALPQGADPVWQRNTSRGGSFLVEPDVVIDALDRNIGGAGVPDVNGAIGKNHYVEMVNATAVQVYDKEGNPIGDPWAANTLWTEFGYASGGDPIVLYDAAADKWLLTEFAPPFSGNVLLIAISETGDPLGSYKAYALNTPSFPDYPKYAIWDNAYILTSNEFNFNDPGLAFYALNRNALIAGEEDIDLQRFTAPSIPQVPGFYTLSPVNWSGSAPPGPETPPMVMRLIDDAWGTVGADRLEIFTIDTIDWEDSDNSVISGPRSVFTAPFDTDPCSVGGGGFSCLPQPAGPGLDAIPLVLMHQLHYRRFQNHESIVLNFVVDASGDKDAGIRWMELRKTPGTNWSVYQEGTFTTNDGRHAFMGGIAIDGAGNIGMGYSVTSDNSYPSLRFTGRRAGDPLGVMTISEYEFSHGQGSSPTDRYGDYASMQVDPVDDRTFWYAGEYVKEGGVWGTGIVAFKLKIDTNDIGPIGLITPKDNSLLTNAETVSFEVQNFGLDTQYTFNAGAFIDGIFIDTINVNTVLPPDSTTVVTLNNTADLSSIQSYEFKLFVTMQEDENLLNDTILEFVTHLPKLDGKISLTKAVEGLLCADATNLTVNLENTGTDTLFSARLERFNNGTEKPSILWNGSLAFGESALVQVPFDSLDNGSNDLAVYLAEVNNLMDQVPSNDTITRSVQAIIGGDEVFLELQFDAFPEETSWELLNELGEVIDFGGPYPGEARNVLEESWCLDPDACYKFVIYDDYGDGLESFGPDGYYEIRDAEGHVLASIMNVNFGYEETNNFCATFTCDVKATIFTDNESAPGKADGFIQIQPENGTGPFQYSIDGGQNFQTSNVFVGLSEGEYVINVRDDNNCIYADTINLIACNIQLLAEVQDESAMGVSDGVIIILSEMVNDSASYSIDGGQNFQSDSVFTGLTAGVYHVVVKDEIGCISQLDSVVVDVSTSIDNPVFGHVLKVLPNPTEGLFSVELKGLAGTQFVTVEIFNTNGALVKRWKLGRLNDLIRGDISLLDQPDGMYYLRVAHPDIRQVVKLIKAH